MLVIDWFPGTLWEVAEVMAGFMVAAMCTTSTSEHLIICLSIYSFTQQTYIEQKWDTVLDIGIQGN